MCIPPIKRLLTIVFIFLSTFIYSQTTFRGVVLDAKNKAPIVDAKIGVAGQGIGEITNDKGYFVYAKYHEVLSEENVLEISAPGYKSIRKKESEIRQLFGAASTIYLERDRKYEHKTITSFEDIILYWDVSASSGKRDFNTEWETVSHFIGRKAVKNIKIVAFNTGIVWEEHIDLSKKSLATLRDKLGNIKAEGLSNYNVIDSYHTDAILLVSNGDPIFGEGHFSTDVPVYTVVSGPTDNVYLNKLSKFTGGETVYLDTTVIQKNVETPLETKNIQGKVTSVSGPIQKARILRSGTLDEIFTDTQGRFELEVQKGDILKISYLGMFSKEITITDAFDYDVELIPANDVLDEVIVKGKRSDEVIAGQRVLKGVDGIIGEEAYITSDGIASHLTTMLDVVKWHFPQVQIRQTAGLKRAFMHETGGPQEIFWYIDGIPGQTISIPSKDPILGDEPEEIPLIPEYLQAKDIESIIVKNAPRRNSNYGVHLSAGEKAIVITTKLNPLAKEKYNPLVKGNDYTEELPSITGGIISQEQRSLIKGKIYNPAGPIQGASILRKGSFDEYFSKADGSFAIPATAGDILSFSYLGMHSKGIVIEDELQFLDVPMEPIAELLDEVIVQGKEREDKKIITAYGEESRDQLGYSVNYVSSDDIPPSVQYVGDILRGRFAGVIVSGFGPTASIQIRPSQTFGGAGGSSEVAWVIDNNIFLATLEDINQQIDPHNIESISILKSNIATNRYGSIAIDGAIVIKTKTLLKLKSPDAVRPGSALVKGNTYEENLKALEAITNVPSYIKELMQLQTLNERFLRYEELANVQDPSVAFYVDMAQYFQQFDTTRASQILDELATLGRSNVKVLRVLAYLYEAGQDYEKARLTYERILKLAPNETQSYRDLALIYQEVGEYNKSLELYINMLGEQIMGLDFSGLEKPLKSELNHLVARYKDKIAFDRLPNEWLRVGYKVDLRMVIEWSDRSVPFEFQFVNPKRKFFEWAHTLDQDKERLFQEQDQGFQTEEFIIDDAPEGSWLVNIQYLGEPDEFTIPPYLKYTIYRNYGTPQETKEVKVIKLYLQEEKVTLSKINA